MMSFSQKTYKWGKTRARTPTAAARRSPASHPGSASTPSTGCTGSSAMCSPRCMGREGTTAHPDFPACASQAAFVLTMRNGGVASVTLDYLRPESAPSHGDERLRIAGSRGVVETALVEQKVTLIDRRQTAPHPPLDATDRHLHAVRPLAPRRIAATAHAARSLPHHGDRHQGPAGGRYRATSSPSATPRIALLELSESRLAKQKGRPDAGPASDHRSIHSVRSLRSRSRNPAGLVDRGEYRVRRTRTPRIVMDAVARLAIDRPRAA